MKLKFALPLLFLFLIGVFVFNIFNSTGFFREITDEGVDKIIERIPIVGAEDIVILPGRNAAIVSSDDRAARREGNQSQGALYLLDLDDFSHKNLTEEFKNEFYPHGISVLQIDSNEYIIHAINHVADEHYIEKFRLIGDSLIHDITLGHESMLSPNDVIAINENQFYFSNDHGSKTKFGRLLEDYLGFARSNIVLFDSENYRVVSEGIAYANGIQVDQDRNLLFLSSPRDFLVKVFSIKDDLSLEFIEDIPCNTGVDNIEFDEDMNLWIGCHPNLLAFASYAAGKKDIAPSELIRINYNSRGDYTIDQIYMNDGSNMSGSTVAATTKNLVLVGNVMDEHFLILER